GAGAGRDRGDGGCFLDRGSRLGVALEEEVPAGDRERGHDDEREHEPLQEPQHGTSPPTSTTSQGTSGAAARDWPPAQARLSIMRLRQLGPRLQDVWSMAREHAFAASVIVIS